MSQMVWRICAVTRITAWPITDRSTDGASRLHSGLPRDTFGSRWSKGMTVHILRTSTSSARG